MKVQHEKQINKAKNNGEENRLQSFEGVKQQQAKNKKWTKRWSEKETSDREDKRSSLFESSQ